MPLILPSNSISGEFEVANSLRFDDGSSDYLDKTFSSAGSLTTWTWSGWIKRANLTGSNQFLFSGGVSDQSGLHFDANEQLIHRYNTAFVSLQTSQVFRDTNAWYHIVAVYDSTNATSSDRMILYVNGSRVTDFVAETYPAQNTDGRANTATSHVIGNESYTGYRFPFDGYMAEVCFIDGTALDPTSFGEFDEDTGIWKPIDVSGLTFGTNGFYLPFENSAALGQDDSGNGNNFTVNNLTSIDQTTDTPTNNYAVLNALDNYYPDSTLSEGNTQTVIGAGDWTPIKANFGLTTGKWYWEIKHSAVSSGSSYATIGIGSNQATGDQQRGGVNATDYSYWYAGELRSNDSLQISVNTYGVGDIIGVALDLDNNNLYFSKNGTWQNSSDPESGSTGTGAFSVTAPSSTPLGAYFPEVGFYDNTNTGTFQCNFGNPPFTISSGNSDANGYGNFEYAVPSGYYALNTKNLAEYG